MGESADDNRRHGTDFLLQEYRSLQESFLRNEELGERRVNFFLTLATAALAALAALTQLSDLKSVYEISAIVVPGLVGLLLFGMFTLLRIVRRNTVTDEYLNGVTRIRRHFTEMHPPILVSLPYDPYGPPKLRTKEWKDLVRPGRGGLAETVALLNSLIFGGVYTFFTTSEYRLLAFFAAFVSAWVLQFMIVKERYERARTKTEFDKELETTFAICSENPDEITEEIAHLELPEPYTFAPLITREIHDCYFDTPERELHKRGLSMRIRTIDGKDWISLKGPSAVTGWGASERREIELPWSRGALCEMVDELRAEQIKLKSVDYTSRKPSHPNVFETMGLEVVQNRVTQRQSRNIVFRDGEDHPILAEFSVDAVSYCLGEHRVNHYEIEIEAKNSNVSSVIRKAAQILFQRHSDVLRTWEHGKLATGMAVADLLRRGMLKELIDHHNLKPDAYDVIEDFLK